MRISPRKLRQIINETLDLGDIAFDPERSDSRRERDGRSDSDPEENTDDEQVLVNALKKFVVGNKEFSAKEVNDLKTLIASRKYDDMLVSYSGEVYRGVTKSASQLKKMLGEGPSFELGDRGSETDVTLSSTRGVTSWSKSREKAQSFADDITTLQDAPKWEEIYTVVITMDVNNSPDCLDLLNVYDLTGVENFSHEREVLLLTKNIHADRVEWSLQESQHNNSISKINSLQLEDQIKAVKRNPSLALHVRELHPAVALEHIKQLGHNKATYSRTVLDLIEARGEQIIRDVLELLEDDPNNKEIYNTISGLGEKAYIEL